MVRVLLPHGTGWNSGSEIKAVHNGNGSVSFTRGKLVPIQKNRYRREAKATESSVIATPDICCTWSWIFSHFSCSFFHHHRRRYIYIYTYPWYFCSFFILNFFSRARSEMSNFSTTLWENALFFPLSLFSTILINSFNLSPITSNIINSIVLSRNKWS